MEVSKNEKNKQLFNVCCEEAYTPDVLKMSCFFFIAFLTRFPVEVYGVYLSVLRVTTQNGPKTITLQRLSLRKRRLREFKQRRRRRLRKRHLKNEFALPQT